ncbi:MAG: hypothetical protein L6R35_006578 [Caloplaca aegaea]|nr:MAG: hypothetical protein L6R35_006578 [Caloplaca aegaea]
MKLIPMAGGEEYRGKRGVSQSVDASQRLSTGLFCSIGTAGEPKALNKVLLGGFDSIHSVEGNGRDPSKLRLHHRPPPDNVSPVFTLVHRVLLLIPTSSYCFLQCATHHGFCFSVAAEGLLQCRRGLFASPARLQFTNMVAVHKETMDSKIFSDTNETLEKTASPASDESEERRRIRKSKYPAVMDVREMVPRRLQPESNDRFQEPQEDVQAHQPMWASLTT